jgi:hypothetical protein
MTDRPERQSRKFRLGALLAIGLGAVSGATLLTYAADAPKAGDAGAPAQTASAPGTPIPNQEKKSWQVHDRSRPQPPIVTPGTFSTPEQPGRPPSDAVVLFDGKDLSQWVDKTGQAEPKWKIENGYFEVAKGTGQIATKESFGDCQFHVEWMAPNPPVGKDQDRGNSGVFLMGRYEFQVLDNYNAPTYADGMAGAIYGQYPPQVNATRPPGEWQTYDIAFRAPRFNEDGSVAQPARATVFLNGVLVQDAVELKGPTTHKKLPKYAKHGPAPITIQDHAHPVRFRNIWIRPIMSEPPVAPDVATPEQK